MTATLTLFHNGLSAGVPGRPNYGAKRGGIVGWSAGAARRNLQFLYSIDGAALGCTVAYAFTFTVRECPPSPEAWAAAVDGFFRSMQRDYGCVRLHWVIEWQKRQVPHLHGCVFFPEEAAPLPDHVLNAWLYLVRFGSSTLAQTVKPMTGALGWFQYVAKHTARGVKHYQRSGEAIPAAWRGRTGRMWGHRGPWPVGASPLRFALDGKEGDGAFFAFRRLVRAWRIADARRSGDRRRIVSARGMLRCPDRARSEVRGVSEWIPVDLADLLLGNLLARGYSIGLPSAPPAVPSPTGASQFG